MGGILLIKLCHSKKSYLGENGRRKEDNTIEVHSNIEIEMNKDHAY